MAGTKLTPKQELFCQKYIETGNASEALRIAFDCSHMKPESVSRKAHEYVYRSNMAERISQLRAELAERHKVTADSLAEELNEAREMAKGLYNPTAMISATMGKARLYGLDKKIVDNTSSDGSMSPKPPIDLTPELIRNISKQLENEC